MRVAVGRFVFVFLSLLAGANAGAQNGELLLSPTNGPPGRAVSVSVVGLPMSLTGQVVTVTFQGNLMLTRTLVSCDPQVGGAGVGLACDGGPISFLIPNVADGLYPIVASIAVSNINLQAVFQVSPDFEGNTFNGQSEPGFEVDGATNAIPALNLPVPNDYDEPPVPQGRFIPRRNSQAHAVRLITQNPPPGPKGDSGPVKIMKNTSLGTLVENYIGFVAEPTAATAGRVSMMSFNTFFTVFSTDCGDNFSLLDARTISPQTYPGGAPIEGGMGGDQHVVYVPLIDRFIWLMQFNPSGPGPTGTNRYRFAVSSPANIIVKNGTNWTIFDLTSGNLGLSTWMDFPGIAIGTSFLYLSANAAGAGSMIVRIPLTDFTAGAGSPLTFTAYRDTIGEFRLIQNCATRQYWANRPKDNQVRIYYWDEISLTSKVYHNEYFTPSSPWPDGNSITPDGVDWLSFKGPPGGNILSGTLAGNEIWVDWNAGRDPFTVPLADRIPQARIDIAVFEATSFDLLGYIALWWPDYAYAFGHLCSTINGDVGLSFMWGGNNTHYPNHAVGFVSGAIDLVNTSGGTASVARAGDYLSLRRYSPDPRLLVAAGYTTWARPLPKQYTHDPHYVLFGRASLPAPICLRYEIAIPGGPGIEISGLKGDPFTIEGSTDLSHWSALYQGIFQNDTFLYQDPNTNQFPWRYYRTVSPFVLNGP
jgi:hypothetical protein